MRVSGSHVLAFCLLGGGVASCSEDPGCAATLEEFAPDGDQALSLLQGGARIKHWVVSSSPPASGSSPKDSLPDQGMFPEWMLDREIWLVEFLAMFLFVFVGCGSAMGVANTEGSAWVLQVSLTFGLAITALIYAFGQYTGAHINCAVTFGLVLVGEITWTHGICYLVSQLLGSIVGALLLWLVYSGIPRLLAVFALAKNNGPGVLQGRTDPVQRDPNSFSLDKTGSLGTNKVADGVPLASALVCEIAGAFLLVYVVLETAVNKKNNVGDVAPLAIGFAVFLAHSVLISIDGCSINPARSTGPAIIDAIANPNSDGKALQHLWVFWVGPLVGAALAAGFYTLMSK